MEQNLPLSELYSHPNKFLEQHLNATSNLAKMFYDEKVIKLFDKDILADIVQIIAVSHDIGKSTKYFQDYLFLSEQQKLKYENKKKTFHSLLSAICSYFLVKEYLNKKIINNWFLPFAAFLVVKKHHGDLEDVRYAVIITEKDIDNLKEQIKNIDRNKFEILTKYIGREIDTNGIERWIDEINNEFKNIKKELRRLKDVGDIINYIKINLFYSILLDADKSDVVIDDMNIFERNNQLISTLVDDFKKQIYRDKSSINDLREEAYREILNKEIDLDKRIFSINLPTGLGKTLISLSFALKLRTKLYSEKGFISRIIYSLPFLSIIDQNFSVFENVLNANNIKTDNNILLKHHHLSEIFYQRDDTEFETDSAKILIEGWNSEIVVTTFIQLFHTLISNKNRSLRKFHRLANSIIILDEIQSFPIRYWLLCKEILKSVAEQLNSYIVFATATEPLIFTREEIYQLADRDKYFKKLDRVTIIPNLENDLTVEEFLKILEMDKRKSYLFIFNTIENSAKKFYKLLKEKTNSTEMTYLSTQILPKERLKRIGDIKQGKYKIVISTQLVEAGVDIDFNIVYRDIAPLDSINQAAGRCNRNDKNHGEVFIVSLKDANGRKFASYIYDPVLIDVTSKLLNEHKKIEEKNFLDLINKYYLETTKKISFDESRDLLKAIYKLKYDSVDNSLSIEHFSLIEKDYTKFDVFVELDDDAKKIWNEYLRIKNIKKAFEHKKAFDNIKHLFYQYVISISQKCENIPPDVEGFRYVPQNCLSDYYDIETGYIAKGGSVIW